MDSSTNICSMPSELIHHLFTFLHYSDLAVLRSTCKRLFSEIDCSELYARFVFDLEKVKLDGLSIKGMEYQNEMLCLEAVKQNWKALKYTKIQNEKICSMAVEQDRRALKYVKDEISKLLLSMGVKRGEFRLRYVQDYPDSYLQQYRIKYIKQ